MESGIKAVFLDIDNTLLSFDGYIIETMKKGFAHYGLKPYEDSMYDTFTRINNGLWEAIERQELTFEELQKIRWNRIFEAMGIDFDGVTFEKYFRDNLWDNAIPMDGAMELLEYLHDKYIICAASNGPYEQQKNRLKVGGMLPYFTDLYVSENIGSPKPTQKFFEECMCRLNRDREESLMSGQVMMIGDSITSDMTGGITCGMKTCLYNFKNRGIPEDSGIDYIVTSLRDIPGRIL